MLRVLGMFRMLGVLMSFSHDGSFLGGWAFPSLRSG